MQRETIRKSLRDWAVEPNLKDAATSADFSWTAARSELNGLPGGKGLNMAHEALDRHAAGPLPDRLAIRAIRRSGVCESWTFSQLAVRSNQFANWLPSQNVAPGDRVCALLGPQPEFAVTAMGTLKARAIFCPLSTRLSARQIRTCLELAQPRLLVTSHSRYLDTIGPLRSSLPPDLTILVTETEPHAHPAGTKDWSSALASASRHYAIAATHPDEPALLHFKLEPPDAPRGILHAHRAVTMHHTTGRFAFDLHPADVFWSTSDIACAVGMASQLLAPLTAGVATLWYDRDFNPEDWLRILQDHHVTVWQAEPDSIGSLQQALPSHRRHAISALRFLASTGAPLPPALVEWGCQTFGLPFHDQWSQAETGSIMIANVAANDIRLGSIGRPLPGVIPHVLQESADGRLEPTDAPEAVGQLAFEVGWPAMFCGYWRDEPRYRNRFRGTRYLTGEMVRRDSHGYYWQVAPEHPVS